MHYVGSLRFTCRSVEKTAVQQWEASAVFADTGDACASPINIEELPMPLIDIGLIKNVCTAEQKRQLIESVTDAVVKVEGEALRPVTWVRVYEIEEGHWAIGGKPLLAADVLALASAPQSS